MANVRLLLHVSNKVSVKSILDTGLSSELVGEKRLTPTARHMFGPGIYLAESAAKADEYAHDGPEFDSLDDLQGSHWKTVHHHGAGQLLFEGNVPRI